MFEYKEMIFHCTIELSELEKLGKDKWEMCGCILNYYGNYYPKYVYYFKRLLLEDEVKSNAINI